MNGPSLDSIVSCAATGGVLAAALSADGRWIASGSEETVMTGPGSRATVRSSVFSSSSSSLSRPTSGTSPLLSTVISMAGGEIGPARGIEASPVSPNRPSRMAFAHPGRSAEVFRDGTRLGWIGQLHPRLLQALGLDTDVVAFELDLAPLLARPLPKAGALSKYPSVRRDLAFVVADSVSWASVSASVKAAAGASLRDLVLFDRYAGKGVETGCKSFAMGLILQEESRTLTDRDVDAVVADVTAALQREHGAAIRT